MRSESKNAFFAVLSTEGRVVGLRWAKLKPKGPKKAHREDQHGLVKPKLLNLNPQH
jgi:hypothetical protein